MRASDPAGGLPAVKVDYSALGRATATLRGLADELSTRDGTLQGDLIGSPVHAAIRHAERDWHGERARLRACLVRAADALDRALAEYRQVDDDVRGALGSRP